MDTIGLSRHSQAEIKVSSRAFKWRFLENLWHLELGTSSKELDVSKVVD
jgi:hypothetical protein